VIDVSYPTDTLIAPSNQTQHCFFSHETPPLIDLLRPTRGRSAKIRMLNSPIASVVDECTTILSRPIHKITLCYTGIQTSYEWFSTAAIIIM